MRGQLAKPASGLRAGRAWGAGLVPDPWPLRLAPPSPWISSQDDALLLQRLPLLSPQFLTPTPTQAPLPSESPGCTRVPAWALLPGSGATPHAAHPPRDGDVVRTRRATARRATASSLSCQAGDGSSRLRPGGRPQLSSSLDSAQDAERPATSALVELGRQVGQRLEGLRVGATGITPRPGSRAPWGPRRVGLAPRAGHPWALCVWPSRERPGATCPLHPCP